MFLFRMRERVVDVIKMQFSLNCCCLCNSFLRKCQITNEGGRIKLFSHFMASFSSATLARYLSLSLNVIILFMFQSLFFRKRCARKIKKISKEKKWQKRVPSLSAIASERASSERSHLRRACMCSWMQIACYFPSRNFSLTVLCSALEH
jgi:hypothetical protein